MTATSRATLFLGLNDQQHYTALSKRARALGAEIVACFQAHQAEDLRPAVDNMTVAAANGRFDLVILPSLDSWGSDPLDALGHVGRLLELGVQIESLNPGESWLPKSPELIVPLAGWLRAQAKARRSEKIRVSLQQARAAGRPCGRPRVVVPAEAIAAVEAGGRIGHVAREFGVAATTLRRGVAEHRAQRLASARVAA